MRRWRNFEHSGVTMVWIRNPWYWRILCKNGHIYPHGGDLLGVSTDLRGSIATRLATSPFVNVVQNGDDGINAVFAVQDFDHVAAIMKPRRRRRLSPSHRAALVASECQASPVIAIVRAILDANLAMAGRRTPKWPLVQPTAGFDGRKCHQN